LYTKILGSALHHRWAVVIVSLAIFGTSLFILPFIKKEFVPVTDQSVFMVNLKLPVTYSLDRTNALVKKCEALIQPRGELKNLYVAVGGFGGNASNTAIMFITMKEPSDRPVVDVTLPVGKGKPPEKFHGRLSQMQFSQWVRQHLTKLSPDLRVSVMDLSQRGMSHGKGYAAELLVTGPSWNLLGPSIDKIRKKLSSDPKLVDVDDNFLDGQPEIQVIPNRAKCAAMGVNMTDLGNVISAAIGGYQFQGIYYHEDGHQNDICIRLKKDQRLTPDAIKHIYVRNNRGEVLPISDVARLVVTTSIQQITRDQRQRGVFFYANAGPGVSQVDALQEAIADCKSCLPKLPGYVVELTGSSQSNNGAFGELGKVMILGIIVAYMVLASQFNSFVHPIVILTALPFSITGAFFALWAGGQSINMYSIIGVILLLGLVKKNSIMLVDFTNQRRRDGLSVKEALLTACPVRLRPILMTSAATIAGALPAAIALGPGAQLRQGMAIAIIGGMFFSTLLTLLVVPCVYSLMSHLERTPPHKFEFDEKGNLTTGTGNKRRSAH
ncbi:MAG: efflux RND transporter permease subunit, partial [bacterium]